jgi:hypothetical protein
MVSGTGRIEQFVHLNYLNPSFTALDEITSIGIDEEASRFINDDRAYQTFWRASENRPSSGGWNSVKVINVGIWFGTRLGPLAQTRFERFYCKLFYLKWLPTKGMSFA